MVQTFVKNIASKNKNVLDFDNEIFI
jgi:hypothetical protein